MPHREIWTARLSPASRDPFITRTPNVEEALRPSGSLAVIVTVASPGATARTVTTLPDAETAATAAFDEAAEYESVSPTESVRDGIVPVGSGARFGTVTRNPRSALGPSTSLARTVTVVTPGASARIATSASDTATAATSVLDEVAV